MRNYLSILGLLLSTVLYAEDKYPVDFDDSFFKRSPFSRWMKDPFKNPPGFAKASLQKSVWPRLSEVSETDKGRFATLDGEKYREGEFIDENRYISSIGHNYVTITEGSFDYELVLSDPKRALASDAEKGSGEVK